jgi:protein SCO1
MRVSHLLGAAFLAVTLCSAGVQANPEAELPILDGVGGDFSAPSSLGREVSLADYRGKVVLVFFGYTSCQDVCPVTLAHLKGLMNRLGPDADRVQVLFVTVDPETDTVETLAKYLPQFDARFVGLSGTPEKINAIAALFMAEHHRTHDVHVSTEHHRTKAFTEESYLYTHAQQIYLLDAAGRTRGLYFSGSPLAEMEHAVRSLIVAGAAGVPEATGSGCDPEKEACPADPHREHHARGNEGDER